MQAKGKINLNRVNPEMIVLARESRGLTQSELAKILSIGQAQISKIENGTASLKLEVFALIAQSLSYPEHFFIQNDQVYGPGSSELYHRKRQNIPIKTLRKAHAQINIRRIHIERLLRSVDIGELFIKEFDIEDYNSPAEIARMVKAYWMLPNGPVQNVVKAIENAGGIVIPCEYDTNKIDAISRWIPGLPPLFFINTNVPVDRLRFTLCHELGHIVMHRMPNPDMEQQADEFAAEFLMPAKEIKASLDGLNFEKLSALKQHWKVSMASLIYRARVLQKITENQSRYLFMQLSRMGYKKREPEWLEPPKEEPMLLKKVIQIHLSELKYTVPQLCGVLALKETEARELYLQPKIHLKLLK